MIVKIFDGKKHKVEVLKEAPRGRVRTVAQLFEDSIAEAEMEKELHRLLGIPLEECSG